MSIITFLAIITDDAAFDNHDMTFAGLTLIHTVLLTVTIWPSMGSCLSITL